MHFPFSGYLPIFTQIGGAKVILSKWNGDRGGLTIMCKNVEMYSYWCIPNATTPNYVLLFFFFFLSFYSLRPNDWAINFLLILKVSVYRMFGIAFQICQKLPTLRFFFNDSYNLVGAWVSYSKKFADLSWKSSDALIKHEKNVLFDALGQLHKNRTKNELVR